MSDSDSGGNLTRIETSYTQGGNPSVWVNHTDANYLSSMDQVVKGQMAVTMSLWGGDGGSMGWLDSPPCDTSVNCDPEAHATWSDFSVHSHSHS